MTDHPEDAPRLTDEQVADAMERASTQAGSGWKRVVLALAVEVRAARALLADLKAEGCPTLEDGSCIYCYGRATEEPGEEPRYDHRPMEDGKPCLYVRIMQA